VDDERPRSAWDSIERRASWILLVGMDAALVLAAAAPGLWRDSPRLEVKVFGYAWLFVLCPIVIARLASRSFRLTRLYDSPGARLWLGVMGLSVVLWAVALVVALRR
jgi:hypothetical protein